MDKHLGGLNPRVREFLEKQPDITLIGFMWALSWRFQIIIGAVTFVLTFGFIFLMVSMISNLT